MAEQIFYGAFLFLDGRDFTCQFSQVDLELSQELQDRTALCDTTRKRVPGLTDWNASYTGFWASDELTSTQASHRFDELNFSRVGSTDLPAMWGPGPLASSADCYFGRGVQENYDASGTVGDLLQVTFGLQAGNSGLTKGRVNYTAESTASSTNGPGASLGAVAADENIFAQAHVFKHSATGTLTVKLVSSTAEGDFSAATTRATFTGFTSTGSEEVSVVGPITDTAFRFDISTTGGTDYGVTACFGIR